MLNFDDSEVQKHSAGLPPIPVPKNAVRLQVVIVERPLGDPMLGPALWNSIDQIGVLNHATRQSLQEDGLRVGTAGSSPPRALESLLGSEAHSGWVETGPGSRWSSREVTLLPDTQSVIQPGESLLAHCLVNVPNYKGRAMQEYRDARFVFLASAKQIQNGWAEIEFVPQIHHGEVHQQPVPTMLGWAGRVGQNIESLPSRRFVLKLGAGEMAVIGSSGQDPSSLGHHFFSKAGESHSLERLLLVRLLDSPEFDQL